MFRSQKHPVVLEKRYAKVLSQWGCHKVTEVSRVVSHLGMQHALGPSAVWNVSNNNNNNNIPDPI